MLANDIRVSVIDVVVDKKLPYFKNSFLSLLEQDFTDFEFVVVIGYPGTETLKFLAEYPDTKFKVVPVVEPQRDPSELPARASAQNIGIEAASGTVLLHTQDDIIFPPNWVSSHIAWHAKFEHPIAVYNRVRGAFSDKDTESENELWKRLSNPASVPIRGRWQYGSGHSFSYPAHLDVRLKEDYNGRWGFEDLCLSYRIHKGGAWTYFDMDVIVTHQPHGDDAWERRERGKDVFLKWLSDRSVTRQIFRELNGFCPEYGTWKE